MNIDINRLAIPVKRRAPHGITIIIVNLRNVRHRVNRRPVRRRRISPGDHAGISVIVPIGAMSRRRRIDRDPRSIRAKITHLVLRISRFRREGSGSILPPVCKLLLRIHHAFLAEQHVCITRIHKHGERAIFRVGAELVRQSRAAVLLGVNTQLVICQGLRLQFFQICCISQRQNSAADGVVRLFLRDGGLHLTDRYGKAVGCHADSLAVTACNNDKGLPVYRVPLIVLLETVIGKLPCLCHAVQAQLFRGISKPQLSGAGLCGPNRRSRVLNRNICKSALQDGKV